MNPQHTLEVEWKFPCADLDEVRRRLIRAGARDLGAVFERNVVLDRQDGELFRKGWLLRVRRDRRVLLTLKRPPDQPSEAGFKIMREDELAVDDERALLRILQALGFRAAFAYEKFRETWKLGDTLVCLDLLPFGSFVELEGSTASLPQAAAILGFDAGRALCSTYKDLHREYLAAKGLPETPDFVFAPEVAEALARRCGHAKAGESPALDS